MCIVNEHKGHDLGEVDSTTRKEFEDEVKKLMAEAEKKIAEFESNLEYVLEVERKVQSQPNDVKIEIGKAFDPLIEVLKNRRTELISAAEKSSEGNLKELWAQKDYLQNTLTGLKSSYSYAKRLQESGKDSEMMMMYSQNLTLTQFKQMEKRKWDGISTRKIESTSFCFNPECLPNLENLRTVHLLSNTVQPASCINFTIDSPVKAELGTKVTVTLLCDNLSPRIRSQFAEIENYSVSIRHGKSQQHCRTICFHYGNEYIQYPKVQKNPDDFSVSVTFIPVVSGKHEIQVRYNYPISGATCTPKQLELTVTGFPQQGAKVVQGPDWASDENAQKNHQLKTGIVAYYHSPDANKVTVEWDYRYYNQQRSYYGSSGSSSNGYVNGKINLNHTWGLNGKYPIQLSIDESNYNSCR